MAQSGEGFDWEEFINQLTSLVLRYLLWYSSNIMKDLTAVYKKMGKWYVGWVEEIPGVNTQGKTMREVKENLKEALFLVLSANKLLSRRHFSKNKDVIREPLTLSSIK